MLSKLIRTGANVGWALSGLGDYVRFRRALGRPERAQAKLLQEFLQRDATSAFGKHHRFGAINSVRDYQDSVPIASYEDLESWVERIKVGERNVLSSERVIAFERTSGSTHAAKFIPHTETLLRGFRRAVGAWMWDLYANAPALARGSSYWCITPLSRESATTSGGIPIGLKSDLEYFGPWSRSFLTRTLAVPASVGAKRNLDDCLYATCLSLLNSPDLAFISVWNPSFLTLLLDFMEQHAQPLLRDLAMIYPKRARVLAEERNANGRFDVEQLWPNLQVISCWTDAAAKLALGPLREKLPTVPVQGKGLLATEGVVSIPLFGYDGHCLAVTSHFLEFESSNDKRPQLAHELIPGEEYSVILTTGGGLWRYRLGDRIRVIGHADGTPLIEFIGREGGISDLRGEKLNPLFIANVLKDWREAVQWDGAFAMLAPVDEVNPSYGLFVDGAFRHNRATQILEQLIDANPHYAYCRQLGQLAHVRIFSIRHDASTSYLRRCESLGQRAGSIKPTCLHQAFGWEDVFHGEWAALGQSSDGEFRNSEGSLAV
jgi:hypothetical protein